MKSLVYPAPPAPLYLQADDVGLTRALFLQGETAFSEESAAVDEPTAWQHLFSACLWLDAYFSRRPLPAMPALHACGTDFQQRVWQMLLEIPYGSLTSYGALARRFSPRMSPQAIGQAVGANPVAIFIPCHRVIAAHGIGGYAGGLSVKRHLLSLERLT